jgi:GH35 family endo-1,4-beta-xylanase
MTYYINVKPDNLKDFLQIVKSLKNLGVIDSFGSVGELGIEGQPVSTETLISVLEASRKEAKEGNVLSAEEVKKQVARWTRRPQ